MGTTRIKYSCRKMEAWKMESSGGSRQNWMGKSGLWPMLHWELQGKSQVSKSGQTTYLYQS